MMKKLVLEIKIESYLDDINKICEQTCEYLYSPCDKFERNEITNMLSDVSGLIQMIKDMIDKLEKEYENE